MRARLLLTAVVYPMLLGCSSPRDEGPGVSGAGHTSAGGSVAATAGTGGVVVSASGGAPGSAGAATGGAADSSGASGGGAAGSADGGAGNAGSGGLAGGAGAGGAANTGGSAGMAGADNGQRPGWTLVWRDEFEGAKGSAPDATKWTPVVARADTNKELEYYSDRPDNLALDGNGFLNITARKESYKGASYTSARIDTAGKFEQAYGRFESRLKIPRGQGIWPAFWIMGNNASVGWPARGELDIMENRGKEPTISIGAMHGPGYSGNLDFRAEHVVAEGVWQSFHVFALEWEPNVVRWYVDDELFETRTPTDLAQRGGGLKWVYDHPFYVIMNVAVGGAFPGSPDDTTPFPQALVADYVRVYRR